MKNITKKQVVDAIEFFLDRRSGIIETKENINKYLSKFTPEKNDNHLDKLKEKLKEAEQIRKEKYNFEEWIEKAASRMAKSLELCTHLSKGIHPSSIGDNINFEGKELPTGLIGSQSIESYELDATGNAASLPLADFLNTQVDKESGIKILDLVKERHHALYQALSENDRKAEKYISAFQSVIESNLDNPRTSHNNKQMLWPIGSDAIENNDYIVIIPLYPSVLTYQIFKKINERNSEENKQAKKSKGKQSYFTYEDIAMVKIGGENPQNVSRCMAKQMGKNYLLSSLPPTKEEYFE